MAADRAAACAAPGLPARLAAAAVALLVAACAQLPYRPSSGPITDVPADVAPPSSSGLSSVYASPRARRELAERVWQLVGERFYDPRMNGVDWTAVRERHVPRVEAATSDAGLYRALKAMLAELRDSHTEVLAPREAVDLRRFVAVRTGVTLKLIDGEFALTEIEPDSPAAAAGLQVGDVVAAVNGVRLDEAFVRAAAVDPATLQHEPSRGDGPDALPPDPRDAERVRALRAVRRLMREQLGTSLEPPPLKLEVRRSGLLPPRKVELKLTSRARPPLVQFRWLDGDVALLHFTRFHPSVREDIDRALDSAGAARALILDLRGNGGGLLEIYRWFAGQFVADERVPLRMTRRDRANAGAQTVAELRIGPGGSAGPDGQRARGPLLQPIAVLIDGRTGSAAELAAVTLAEQRGALLVGEPTCGCVVGVSVEYVLPDGGGLRVAETGFVSARGARMEGEPTLPALRVVPQLGDLRTGRDPVLDEAHRRLLVRLAEGRAARP